VLPPKLVPAPEKHSHFDQDTSDQGEALKNAGLKCFETRWWDWDQRCKQQEQKLAPQRPPRSGTVSGSYWTRAASKRRTRNNLRWVLWHSDLGHIVTALEANFSASLLRDPLYGAVVLFADQVHPTTPSSCDIAKVSIIRALPIPLERHWASTKKAASAALHQALAMDRSSATHISSPSKYPIMAVLVRSTRPT